MTSTTDDVLKSIDSALAGDGTVCFGETGDSMRWLPGMVICHEGVASGPAPKKAAPVLEWDDDGRPGFTVTAHYRTGLSYFACVRATVYTEADRDATERKMAKARHPYPGWSPRPASRCGDCNPRGNPEPLAVDGHDYTRRQRARRQRKA
jgi:hypothetical protein